MECPRIDLIARHTKTALALMKAGGGFFQLVTIKIWPEFIAEKQNGLSALPQ
jgi:hypothetical protein